MGEVLESPRKDGAKSARMRVRERKKEEFSLLRSLATTINGGKFDLRGKSTFVGKESADEQRTIE